LRRPDFTHKLDPGLTLVLGHTLHTIVGSQYRVGRSVDSVPSLVFAPHVPTEDTVTDGLADVSTQHGVGGGSVLGSLVLVNEAGSGSVSGTVTDEDCGTMSQGRVIFETVKKHDLPMVEVTARLE
jgi:hypothetical protein